MALQPLSAGNSAEFSQADNSKTIQPREINLISLDSLGFCESIYVYLKPPKLIETSIKSLYAEFSQADNSKTIQPREINLISLDSLGFCESIYVYLKPPKLIETSIKSLYRQPEHNPRSILVTHEGT